MARPRRPSLSLQPGPDIRARRLAPIAVLLIALPAGQTAFTAWQASSAAQGRRDGPSSRAGAAVGQPARKTAGSAASAQAAATFSVDAVITAPGMDTRLTIYLPARIGEGLNSNAAS